MSHPEPGRFSRGRKIAFSGILLVFTLLAVDTTYRIYLALVHRPATPAAMRHSSLAIAALCEQLGIAYLHVLQPTLHDAGSKPLTKEELASATMDEAWLVGVRHGYPLMRSRIRSRCDMMIERIARALDPLLRAARRDSLEPGSPLPHAKAPEKRSLDR